MENSESNVKNKHKFKGSLAFKLSAPVLVFAVLLVFIIERVSDSIAQQVVEKNSSKKIEHITESLILFSDVNSSFDQLDRVVNGVATRNEVLSLRLVDNRSELIVSDNKNQYKNKKLSEVATPTEIALFNKHLDVGGKKRTRLERDHNIYLAAPIALLDPEVDRLRLYSIVLVFDTSSNVAAFEKLKRYIVVPFLLFLVVLVAVMYIVQHRVLIKPLRQMGKALAEQRERSDQILLDESSGDELGLLAFSYNQLAESQHLQELELMQARRYIDGIADQVPVLLSYIDRDFVVRFANKLHENWFPEKPIDFHGLHLKEAYGESVYEQIKPYIDTVFKGESVTFEMHSFFSGDKSMSVLVTCSPDKNAAGEVNGTFVCVEDRTLLRDTEEKLISYASDLEFKTWALEEAKLEAESSTHAKSEFLASMSHEIRTPINGVIGMLNLVKKGELSNKQYHYVKQASSSAESLLSLINDILDFSKIEAGKLDIENIDFNLYEAVGGVAESFSYLIEEKGLAFRLDIDPEIPLRAIGDPSRVRQVLNNFMSNAIKFTEEGEVVCEVKSIDENDKHIIVEFSVTDSGIGIPEDKQALMFQSFSQVDASTTRKYGGTGLGLAIVKKLSELMHGDVGFESKAGKGSRFWFQACLSKVHGASGNEALFENVTVVSVGRINPVNFLESFCRKWSAELKIVSNTKACRDYIETLSGKEATVVVLFEGGDTSFDFTEVMAEITDLDLLANIKFIPVLTFRQLSSGEYPIADSHNCLTQPLQAYDFYRLLNKASNMYADVDDDLEQLGGDRKTNILLVEDNVINQEVALGILEPVGCSVEVAGNGLVALSALVAASENHFDLILMDCQMPAMDGFETTRLIRKGNIGINTGNIPIIAMTANAMKGDKELCLEAGMDDYISKPVEPSVLINKISQWTRTEIIDPEAGIDSHTESDKGPNHALANAAGRTGLAGLDNEETTDSAIEAWCRDSLLRRVRGKPERAKKLIQMFLDGMPDRIERLKSAVASNDLEQVHSVAHEIKGVSGNISTLRLHKTSTELEQAAMKGLDDGIPELLSQTVSEYLLVEALLREYIDAPS
ncbi:MAG: response regulator [Agarilytica sp.]